MIETEVVYILYDEVYNCNRCTGYNEERETCEIFKFWLEHSSNSIDSQSVKLTERLGYSLEGIGVCSPVNKNIKKKLESKINSYLNFLALIA